MAEKITKVKSYLTYLLLMLFWNPVESDNQVFYGYQKDPKSTLQENKIGPLTVQPSSTSINVKYPKPDDASKGFQKPQNAYPTAQKDFQKPQTTYPLPQKAFNTPQNAYPAPQKDFQKPQQQTNSFDNHDSQNDYQNSYSNNFERPTQDGSYLHQDAQHLKYNSNVLEFLEKIYNQLVHVVQLLTIQVLEPHSESTKPLPPAVHPLNYFRPEQSSTYRLPVENIQVNLNRNKQSPHKLAYHEGEPLQLGSMKVKYKRPLSSDLANALNQIQSEDLKTLMLAIQDEIKNRGIIPNTGSTVSNQQSVESPNEASENIRDILWKLIFIHNDSNFNNSFEMQTVIKKLQEQIMEKLLEDFSKAKHDTFESFGKPSLSLDKLLKKVQEGKINLGVFP